MEVLRSGSTGMDAGRAAIGPRMARHGVPTERDRSEGHLSENQIKSQVKNQITSQIKNSLGIMLALTKAAIEREAVAKRNTSACQALPRLCRRSQPSFLVSDYRIGVISTKPPPHSTACSIACPKSAPWCPVADQTVTRGTPPATSGTAPVADHAYPLGHAW